MDLQNLSEFFSESYTVFNHPFSLPHCFKIFENPIASHNPFFPSAKPHDKSTMGSTDNKKNINKGRTNISTHFLRIIFL
ncbi:hypothetical protein PMALA_040700 [Plasmodium malariae]|uniref:Uncharacterized protein n=1 Tax=Plasmodium malariae TaxID=5858 RepID=A0A1A8WPB7_PLAMA|nr:hypothetical protein PMALA_040700 [Plasmodium malariae]